MIRCDKIWCDKIRYEIWCDKIRYDIRYHMISGYDNIRYDEIWQCELRCDKMMYKIW